jgi:hypothetical protein
VNAENIEGRILKLFPETSNPFIIGKQPCIFKKLPLTRLQFRRHSHFNIGNPSEEELIGYR